MPEPQMFKSQYKNIRSMKYIKGAELLKITTHILTSSNKNKWDETPEKELKMLITLFHWRD